MPNKNLSSLDCWKSTRSKTKDSRHKLLVNKSFEYANVVPLHTWAALDCHFPLWAWPNEGISGRPIDGWMHFHFHNLRIWVTVLIVCNYYSICEARLSCRVESANLIKFKHTETSYERGIPRRLGVQRTPPNYWPNFWGRKEVAFVD